MSSPEINFFKELSDIKAALSDIRVTLTKLETIQEERTNLYKKLTQDIEDLETELASVNRRVTYAAGILAAAIFIFDQLSSIVFKKIGA